MRKNRPFRDWSGSLRQDQYMLCNLRYSIFSLSKIIGAVASDLCTKGINASELYKCQNTIRDTFNNIEKFESNLEYELCRATYKHKKRDMKKRNKG